MIDWLNKNIFWVLGTAVFALCWGWVAIVGIVGAPIWAGFYLMDDKFDRYHNLQMLGMILLVVSPFAVPVCFLLYGNVDWIHALFTYLSQATIF